MPVPRFLLILVGLGLGCSRAPRPAPAVAPSPSCVVAQPDPAAGDTIAVLLGEPVDPAHAPIPTNDAEALVFRQLYETLVRVSCENAVAPGLATAWRADGAVWTFTLRPGAAFRDGSPLDATTILEQWRTTDSTTAVSGVRSDGATLTVFLAEPRPVTWFADPALRLVRRNPESVWPAGTASWAPAPQGGDLRSLTLVAAGRSRGAIRFSQREVADPRDLLDAGTAILVSRDPATIAYAASLEGWNDAPLAWDRTYVLLVPGAVSPDSASLPAIRAELARDVVRGDARPAGPEAAAWLSRCLAPAPDVGALGNRPARRRVVFPRHDSVARRLAERLVARADSYLAALLGAPAVGTAGTITAAGLGAAALDSALSDRNDWAVVLPVFPSAGASCVPMSALGGSWGAVVPLVETRAHGLVRSGTARVVRDRDGLVIEPAASRR